MRQLRLVGVADDGASLLLETPTGEGFRLPLDERVRAACRGDLTRLGQIEIELDNPLRPREIQTRVRAGESAEEVAASAGMPVERVLRFAYPVLQERARVVAQARSTQVHPKRPHTLAELVDERLVGRGTDAATLRWDAWRREDGRWVVRLTWRHAAEHSASWLFQLASRTLQPDDPAAEQLSAEEFHARTITAVTPLAVAARVSGRPGGASAHPAGTGRPGAGDRPAPGDRPARGVEARAGRSARLDPGADPIGRRAAARVAARTRPAERPAGATPADQAVATRPGDGPADGATAVHAGPAGVAAGTDRAAADHPAGARPTGADPTGADPTAADPAGTDPTGADPTAADPAGAHPAGAHPAGAHPAGAHPAGAHPAGADPAGAELAGVEPAGAERGVSRPAPPPSGAAATTETKLTAGRADRTAAGADAASRAPGGATGGSEPTAGGSDLTAGDRTEARSTPAGGRTRRRPPPEAAGDPGEPLPPRRIAAGGESGPRAETDEERARRASIPSWDDILLGVRRRH